MTQYLAYMSTKLWKRSNFKVENSLKSIENSLISKVSDIFADIYEKVAEIDTDTLGRGKCFECRQIVSDTVSDTDIFFYPILQRSDLRLYEELASVTSEGSFTRMNHFSYKHLSKTVNTNKVCNVQTGHRPFIVKNKDDYTNRFSCDEKNWK